MLTAPSSLHSVPLGPVPSTRPLFGKSPSDKAKGPSGEANDTFSRGTGLPKPDTTVRDVLDAARLASQLSPNEPLSPAGVFAMPHLVLTTPLIREPLTLNGQDVLALLVYMQQQAKENPIELSASATLGRLLDPFEERSANPWMTPWRPCAGQSF